MDPVTPSLGLSLGISPSSSAMGGTDFQYTMPDFSRGNISFGGGISETPVSGLIRDGALVLVLIGLALYAKKRWL